MFQSGFEAQLNRFPVVGYDTVRSGVAQRLSTAAESLGSVQEGRAGMDVRNLGSVSGATPYRPVNSAPASRDHAVSRPQIPRDELVLSNAGKLLDQLSQNGDIRQERIAQIKAAIADGTYDTDEKLEAALMRMFSVVESELDQE